MSETVSILNKIVEEWERQGWPLETLHTFRMEGGDEDSDDDNDDADHDDDNSDDEKKFSQADLTRLLAREKRDGRKSALKEFAKEFGYSNVEDLKKDVQSVKDKKQQQETEAERKAREADDRSEKADDRERKAWQKELNAEIRSALLEAGMPKGDVSEFLSLVKVDLEVGDDIDEETVTAAVEDLKERRARLFEAPDDDDQEKNKTRVPGTRPAKPKKQTSQTKPADKAQEILQRRHSRTLAKHKS